MSEPPSSTTPLDPPTAHSSPLAAPATSPGVAAGASELESAEAARRPGALLLLGLLLLALLYLGNIGGHPLQDPDEGRYAEIPREMIESGDWTTPRLNYVKYFEKPPLLYWLVATSFSAFGTSDGAARLVPALAGIATVLITFALGQAMLGFRAAWLAAGILATAPLFFGIAQSLVIDMPLTACITAALACLWGAHRSSRPRRWAVGVAIATALGVLAKGPVALVLPGAVALAYLALRRDTTTLKALLSPAPIAAFALLVVPWFALVARRNPEFLHFFFVHEHFLRFTAHVGHPEGPFFYVPVLLLGALPWTVVTLGLALTSTGRGAVAQVPSDARFFLLLWAGLMIAFFTAASSKLAPYVLPAFPALALLTAGWLDAAIAASPRDVGRVLRPIAHLVAGFGILLLVIALLAFPFARTIAERIDVLVVDVEVVRRAALGVAVGFFAGGISAARLLRGVATPPAIATALIALMLGLGVALFAAVPARAIAKSAQDIAHVVERERQPGDVIAVYKRIMQTLSFYTASRVVMIDTLNELRFGAEHAADRADYFWEGPQGLDKMRAEWKSRRMMIATSVSVLDELEAALPTRVHLLAREGRRVLIANFPPSTKPRRVEATPAR